MSFIHAQPGYSSRPLGVKMRSERWTALELNWLSTDAVWQRGCRMANSLVANTEDTLLSVNEI